MGLSLNGTDTPPASNGSTVRTRARLTHRPFLSAALQGSAPRVEQPPQPAAPLGAVAPDNAPHVPAGAPLHPVNPEKTRGAEQGGASQRAAPPPASAALLPPRLVAPAQQQQRVGRTVPHPARENPFHSWGVPGTVDTALKRAFGADFVPSNNDTVLPRSVSVCLVSPVSGEQGFLFAPELTGLYQKPRMATCEEDPGRGALALTSRALQHTTRLEPLNPAPTHQHRPSEILSFDR